MTGLGTQRWCDTRDHPFVTYNPWLDRSYCRCGRREETGPQPMDWQAKHETHHHCMPTGPCRCYVQGKPFQPSRPPGGAREASSDLADRPHRRPDENALKEGS